MLDGFDHRRYLIPFRSQLLPHVFTDTLVIGSGVAGMRAALAAADHGEVIMLAKRDLSESATAWAQGGVAAAHAPGDTPVAHLEDTLTAGAGLCDPEAVRALVDEGPAAIDELISWGMTFDRIDGGALAYGREGGHRTARILHAGGATTGLALVDCLANRVAANDRIRLFDHCFALDLLTRPTNSLAAAEPVLGAITFHPSHGLQIIWARATILASGGAGQVYRETTNPSVATGDGFAIAYRAGAEMADLEFVQFHPTTLYVAGASRELISEAVRGENAHLLDADGVRFMPEYHELAELAPRDVVSRAIADRIIRTQAEAVYLDARHLDAEKFQARFPSLVQKLRSFDLDPARDLVPVHPSAHYTMGGIRTDLDGHTSLPGLLACGEVSITGVHGANRLASNSLLEGLVFGRRAGEAAGRQEAPCAVPLKIISEIPPSEHAELDLVDVRSSLRSAMWRNVGIVRSGNKLDDVQDMFGFWARYTMDVVFDDPSGWETQNLLTVGTLMTRAARWRHESRGAHRRSDFPEPDDAFLTRASWRRGRDEPEIEAVPAPAEATA